MPLPTGTIDRSYLLHEQLGEGGMGTVYRATQLVNGKAVALKLVPHRSSAGAGASESPEVQFRLALAREFQTLASLHHPNVIRVLNYGFDEQHGPYYIMELLEGPRSPLDASIEQSEEWRIRLIAQLLRALAYIHQRSVIHRDIKPSNVLVTLEELKLLDFGISVGKSESADFAGTLEYMAPELLRGQSPSVASDLYAVGLLFHQMLTGSLPTDTPSMGSMLDSILGDDVDTALSSFDDGDRPEPEPQPLVLSDSVSLKLRSILSRLLAPKVDERYSDANVVLRELAAAVEFELPVETAATRESFLRATVLIGRDAELAELKEALDKAKRGAGSAVLIGGESGVGKSRLIAELRTLAMVHGCWVAEGQSVTDGGSYYQEWLPMLRALCFRDEVSDAEAMVLKDLIPDIATLLGRPVADAPPIKPEAALQRLTNTLVSLLQRQSKPLLLILEDLHWIRGESQALLAQLCKSVPSLPLLLVGTYRSDESPELPQKLPAFRSMQLSRLTPQGITRLSESMLGPVGKQPQLIDYLLRQTDGNVFFLVEIVRALAEQVGELDRIGQGELPENVLTVGIERIVERRLDKVSTSYRPLLEFSATLGRKLDTEALARVFPQAPLRDFLIDCANAAILESQGTEWRFAHDKLREAIRKGMDAEQRKALHLKVAETLEDLYTGKEREALNASLAYHYKEAGVPEKAFQYFVKAGDIATKLYIYDQARSHYAAAEALLPSLSESMVSARVRIDLLSKQVQSSMIHAPVAVNQQRVTQARELLQSVPSTEAEQLPDRLRLARLDYYDARLWSYLGKPALAMPLFKKVLPVAQEHKVQDLLFETSIQISFAVLAQGAFAKSSAMLSPLLEQIRQRYGADMETLRSHCFAAIDWCAMGMQQRVEPHLEEMRSWVKELGQASVRGYFNGSCSLWSLMAGNWPGVVEACKPLIEGPGDSVESLYRTLGMDVSAWAYSHMNQHQRASSLRAQAVALRSTIGGGIMKDWCEAGEAEIHLNAGRAEEALEQAKKTVATYQPHGLLFTIAVAERVWGCALARLGADMAEAEAHFKNSLSISDSAGNVTQSLQTELWWGRICRERGLHGEAALHFERARGQFTDEMSPYMRETALRIIAGEDALPGPGSTGEGGPAPTGSSA